MKARWFFLLLLGACFSCEEEPAVFKKATGDYLIFGHFYGFCAGEGCIEIFLIDDEGLFEDTNDTYPAHDAFYEAAYKSLPAEKFELVKSLRDEFPAELWNMKDRVIGMPDAGDWGGYYVEYRSGNERRFWIVDKMRNNVPEAIHPFLDKMDEKIALINPE